MIRKSLSLILSLTVLFGAGCAGKAPEPVKGPVPVKLGVLPIEDNLPFYIAEQDKLFDTSIQVSLVPFASAQERDVALQAGQIDGEVSDLVATTLLKKGGVDVKVVSIGLGATPKEGRFALLAAPNSNITSPKDLKDVDVAISENSIIEYVTDQMLKNSGITSYKKISIPKIPVRMQMLLSGQVKTAVLPDPMATLAEKQGAKLIMDDTKGDNLSQTVIAFRQESINTKKEALRKVVLAYEQAGKALTENPEKYRTTLIEKAKVPEQLKDTYQAPSFSKPQLPQEGDVKRIVDWMVEKKLLDKPYSYSDLVDPTIL